VSTKLYRDKHGVYLPINSTTQHIPLIHIDKLYLMEKLLFKSAMQLMYFMDKFKGINRLINLRRDFKIFGRIFGIFMPDNKKALENQGLPCFMWWT